MEPITAGRFTLRLADSEADIAAAQRLRYRVFVEEMGAQASDEEHELRRERDEYDTVCDHLLLFDTFTHIEDPLDQVVGVYRLLLGDRAMGESGPGFYSATEYDLSVFDAYPGRVVELGRSCVAEKYRGGAAMQLLWMGLGQYITNLDIKLLFGCASFHGTNLEPMAHSLSHLHHNHLAPDELRPRTLDPYYESLDLMPATEVDTLKAMRGMPTLIKAYLRLGGMIGDGAYIDHEFRTVDVCVITETDQIAERYKSFYARKYDSNQIALKLG